MKIGADITVRSVEKSWELFAEALELIPRGTVTMSKAPKPWLKGVGPVYMVRGRGSHVWDLDGNEYIDYRNALGPVTLGYNVPEITRAVQEQIENGVIFGHPHPLEVEVARELVRIIPCAEQVRFLKTGGEAMAAAIKTARAATGRELCLTCGYHGWLQTVPDQGVPAAVAALYPAVAYGDVEGLAHFLEQHGENTACLCIAGSYTAMGPGDDWWARARELTRQHGVLLIYDEIVTGFRLALGGAQEYFGVIPDLAVFSKGIANGFPLAAVVGKREVMEALNRATVSSTFAGDTVGLAAAKACLRFYTEHDVIGHCWRLGELLGRGLNEVFARTGFPAQVRGLPVVSRPYMASNDTPSAELEQRFYIELYRRGISADGPLWYLTWSHSEEDIAATVTAAEAAARAAMQVGTGS